MKGETLNPSPGWGILGMGAGVLLKVFATQVEWESQMQAFLEQGTGCLLGS